jgi:succinate dehydrogenase / fumarate reductase, cytochrome b subunit
MATATASKRDVPSNRETRLTRPRLLPALGTTVGSKYVVALTGLGLTGYVIAHMSGNLLIYQGRDALNSYAQFLKDHRGPLWAARIGLLAIFVLHIGLAVRLKLRNRAARPTPYAYEDTIQASWASRHMLLTGLVILAFVVFHLLHYTFGLVAATAPNGQNYLDLTESLKQGQAIDPARGRHDVYAMTVYGFRNVWVSLAYIVAQVLLGLHLSHGIASTFQSLGWCAPRVWPALRSIGLAIAVIVVIGNCSMPLAVMTGAVGRDVSGQPPFRSFFGRPELEPAAQQPQQPPAQLYLADAR